MSGFITEIDAKLKCGSDSIWIVHDPLIYYSDILKQFVSVPEKPGQLFYTDLASIPRLPLIFTILGGRFHREGVLHDYLFRKDSKPTVSFWIANRVLYEAMRSRNKNIAISSSVFIGVMIGGYFSFHKRNVLDVL